MNSMPVCNWCSYDKWQNFCLVLPRLFAIYYIIAISISLCMLVEACKQLRSPKYFFPSSFLSAFSFRISEYECAQLDTAMPCLCCYFFSHSITLYTFHFSFFFFFHLTSIKCNKQWMESACNSWNFPAENNKNLLWRNEKTFSLRESQWHNVGKKEFHSMTITKFI